MKNQEYNTEYYEIDLMDYVKVLFKRKWLIIGITAFSVICALAFTLSTPTSYKAEAVLKPGKSQKDLLEEPQETVAVLKQSSTFRSILDRIDTEVSGESTEDKVTKLDNILTFETAKDTNFITIKGQGKSSELAVQSVQTAAELTTERHKKLLENEKELLQKRIENKEAEIKQYQNEIEELNQQISSLQRGDSYLEGEGLALQGYLASLRNSQANLSRAKEDLNKLEDQKNEMKNTEIIGIAKNSLKTVKPKLKLNTAIAAVLGGFIGVFGAFLVEWWEENKSKLETN